jgi:polyferredoxin
VTSLALRAPFKADVVRDRGALARMVEDGRVENVYRLQLMNATEQPQRLRVEVEGLPGATVHAWSVVDLLATESRWVPVAVQIAPQEASALSAGAHPFTFRIRLIGAGSGDGAGPGPRTAELHEKSTFIVPR